ncbi:MAG: RNA polymerase sigma factor [Acidobacteriota bacterium]|nr:RNA polymerase sigma factor [Acidobacteriota bacterium]
MEHEHALIQACGRGDLGAFEALYREYAPAMMRTARRMLHSREDAEDALQQAFLKLHRSLGNFRFNAKFSTFAYRIMMNVCLDMIDKSKRQVEQTAMEAGPEPRVAPRGLLRLKLEQAVGELPERMRGVFVLFAVEGLSQQEIADIMDISVGTVKAQIFQAKARLRGVLGEKRQEAVS